MFLAKAPNYYTLVGAFYRDNVSKGGIKDKAKRMKTKTLSLSPFIALYRGKTLQNIETH